jgi:hypothetical protein
MRLIDADALIDFIDCGHLRNPLESCFSERDVVDMLESRPTIDAVLVVRCGECMYRQKAKVNRKGFLICPASGMEITDDDYCSYGAKMEDKP